MTIAANKQRDALSLLSDRQKYALTECYSEGIQQSLVALRLGVSTRAVERLLKRAGDRLASAGLPRPKPYGRGNRAELRRAIPALSPVT